MNTKLNIRPTLLNVAISADNSRVEVFQNQTLRPVIKLQNDLLIAMFHNYTTARNVVLGARTEMERREYINDVFRKDAQLKTMIRGIVIGLFTVDEFHQYQDMSTEINKRITALVIERLLSSL